MPDSPVIVVGYRSGFGGREALEYAGWLATRIGAALDVVHVADLDDYPPDPDGLDWETEAEQSLAAARREVEVALRHHTGTWSFDAVRGEPAEVLARIADEREASMVVVGVAVDESGGLLHRALGRSAGRDLLRHARRPVLFVPSGPAR